MKKMGLVLIVAGILGGAFAFNLDTSVETGGETIGSGKYAVTIPKSRVNNLGLMEERRNYLGASGLAILVGVILFGFGSLQRPAASPSTNATSGQEQQSQDARELAQRLAAGQRLSSEQITLLVEASRTEKSLAYTTNRVNGNSLLHLAAEANLASEAKALIELGVSAHSGNGNGKKPYQLTSDQDLSTFLKYAAGV